MYQTMVDQLAITSLNVRGLNETMKRRKIFGLLHRQKADIVLLQETHSVKKIQKIWRNEWGGQIYFSHYNSRSRGVAIMFRKELDFKVHDKFIGPDGRVIILQIEVAKIKFVVSNVYAPNEENVEFFKNLFQRASAYQNPYTMFAGDFNLVLDLQLDRSSQGPDTKRNARECVQQNMQDMELIDVWREENPELRRYTCFSKIPHYVGSRIDYMLISAPLRQFCREIQIGAAYASDHAPILGAFSIAENQRGKGLWKFNNSLLKDKEFREFVDLMIDEVLQNREHESDIVIWETIKAKLKAEIICYSIRKKKNQDNKLDALTAKFQQIQDSLADKLDCPFTNKNEITAQLNLVQKDIDELLEIKTKGSMVRSKANWFEYGEKMSAYFFALEKSNQQRKCIHSLRTKEGQILTHDKEILEHQRLFYEQLYKAKEEELHMYPPFIIRPLLSNEERQSLNEPITLKEMDIALHGLALNKSPGQDGLSVNFYQTFWSKLRDPLVAALEEGLRRGLLHDSARRGIITLIPKKNKDLMDLANWRPITLLNNDYKILSKVLANRMKNVMDRLISINQTGFMKGRNIGENILTLTTVIEHIKQAGKSGILVSIDFKKAFDLCEFPAIWGALEYFNYGDRFIYFLKTLYNESECCIINNGWISDTLRVERGLKQGDPVSSLLFIHVIEILSLMLLNNENIQGFEIQGIKKLLGQYADDIWNIIKDNEESFTALFQTYSNFEECTGLTINYDKTEIMRIGCLEHASAEKYTLLPLKWTSGPIKILGIDIHNDIQTMSQVNFQSFRIKLLDTVKRWQNRGLSLIGKILVINTLLISQMVYKLLMVCMLNEPVLQELVGIIVEFLWDGKKPKIAYRKLILNYKQGGLNLCDLYTKNKAMKLSWVPKLLLNTEWGSMFANFLPIPLELFFMCNLSARHIKRLPISHAFLKEIALYWTQLNFTNPKNTNQVLMQVIWYNSHMTINNSLMYNERLYLAGIRTVNDIFDSQNRRFYDIRELQRKFQVNLNIMELYRIIQAIPLNWKVMLRALVESDDRVISLYEMAKKEGKISRVIYSMFIDQNYNSPQGSKLIWEQNLNKQIDDKKWESICHRPGKITLCTKLRLFQYKITQRCLVTNIQLKYYGIIDQDLCTFCGLHRETIMHLFWECQIVQRAWMCFKNIVRMNYGDNRLGNMAYEFMFNIFVAKPADYVNTLTLIFKRFIYVTRCEILQKGRSNVALNVNNCISMIARYEQIERYVAIRNNKLDKHESKWANVINM